MTLRDVLSAMLERWYVSIACLIVCIALAASFLIDGGTYYTKTVVWFTMQSTSTFAPDYLSRNDNAIAYAGTVATEINRGRPAQRYSASSAPYYGAGVRQGVLVALQDEGNQWSTNFDTAAIDIEIVGRTQEWVQAQQSSMIQQIHAMVDAQDAALDVAAGERVQVSVEPLTSAIVSVTPSRLAQVAGISAMVLVGLIVGGYMSVLINRTATRRRRRPGMRSPVTQRPPAKRPPRQRDETTQYSEVST